MANASIHSTPPASPSLAALSTKPAADAARLDQTSAQPYQARPKNALQRLVLKLDYGLTSVLAKLHISRGNLARALFPPPQAKQEEVKEFLSTKSPHQFGTAEVTYALKSPRVSQENLLNALSYATEAAAEGSGSNDEARLATMKQELQALDDKQLYQLHRTVNAKATRRLEGQLRAEGKGLQASGDTSATMSAPLSDRRAHRAESMASTLRDYRTAVANVLEQRGYNYETKPPLEDGGRAVVARFLDETMLVDVTKDRNQPYGKEILTALDELVGDIDEVAPQSLRAGIKTEKPSEFSLIEDKSSGQSMPKIFHVDVGRNHYNFGPKPPSLTEGLDSAGAMEAGLAPDEKRAFITQNIRDIAGGDETQAYKLMMLGTQSTFNMQISAIAADVFGELDGLSAEQRAALPPGMRLVEKAPAFAKHNAVTSYEKKENGDVDVHCQFQGAANCLNNSDGDTEYLDPTRSFMNFEFTLTVPKGEEGKITISTEKPSLYQVQIRPLDDSSRVAMAISP